MNGSQIATFVAALAAAISSVAALITSLRNRDQIQEVHLEFNSKMDAAIKVAHELADTRVTAAYAKGKEDKRLESAP